MALLQDFDACRRDEIGDRSFLHTRHYICHGSGCGDPEERVLKAAPYEGSRQTLASVHAPGFKRENQSCTVLVAFYHKTNGRLDKAGLETIQICYGFLADFVSDDVAEKSKNFDELVHGPETLKRIQEDPVSVMTKISKTPYTLFEEMNTSNQDFAHLCDEFELRLNVLDDPAGKSEEFTIIRKLLLGG